VFDEQKYNMMCTTQAKASGIMGGEGVLLVSGAEVSYCSPLPNSQIAYTCKSDGNHEFLGILISKKSE